MTDQDAKISSLLYLNSRNLERNPINKFSDDEIKYMKRVFFNIYKSILADRGVKSLIFGPKEARISNNLFNWCISSPEFEGDLKKGVWLSSAQGFGKDIFLKTIVLFFRMFNKGFIEFSFSEFNKQWYEKSPYYFNRPVKINDIDERGYIKRERYSIPILEFMDHREQINNRRSIIVSSNYTPAYIQKVLEPDSDNQKILERAKECFNLIVVKDAESKRTSNNLIL